MAGRETRLCQFRGDVGFRKTGKADDLVLRCEGLGKRAVKHFPTRGDEDEPVTEAFGVFHHMR